MFRISNWVLPTPDDLDPLRVGTLADSQFLQLLTSGPVWSYGTWVESVHASAEPVQPSDFARWRVLFRQDAKFSDGQPLTSENWLWSLVRVLAEGNGVHFNPRRDFRGGERLASAIADRESDLASLLSRPANQSIHWLQDRSEVELTLAKPNRSFSRMLGKVDAAVLPLHDYERGRKIDWKRLPSSGPYSLKSRTQEKWELIKNPHHLGHAPGSPVEAEILNLADADAFGRLLSGEIDIVFPRQNAEPELHARILAAGHRALKLFGQTFTLSFRERPTNPWTRNVSLREHLAAAVQQIRHSLPGSCELTHSLLQGPGLGRLAPTDFPTPTAAKSARPAHLPRLRISSVKGPLPESILSALQKIIPSIEHVWAHDFGELFSPSHPSAETEALLTWNDYCGEDPFISLYNGFNPSRPLLWDSGGNRDALLETQNLPETGPEKNAAYQNLHKKILNDFGVIPICAEWDFFYFSTRLDLSFLKGHAPWKTRKSG